MSEQDVLKRAEGLGLSPLFHTPEDGEGLKEFFNNLIGGFSGTEKIAAMTLFFGGQNHYLMKVARLELEKELILEALNTYIQADIKHRSAYGAGIISQVKRNEFVELGVSL